MSKHHAVLSVSALALVSLTAAIFLLAHQMAQAQSEPAGQPGATADPDAPPAPPDGLPAFGQLHPADEGALSYDDLSPAEQAASDLAAEWAEADHGVAVHDRWRQASREGVRLSKLKQAEYESGLAGLAGLGED